MGSGWPYPFASPVFYTIVYNYSLMKFHADDIAYLSIVVGFFLILMVILAATVQATR